MDLNKKQESLIVWLLTCVQIFHILDFVILMPLGPTIMREFNISPAQFAGLVSSYNFSAALTGFVFGTIADRFDRKNLILISSVLFVISTAICAIASNYSILLIARIFSGAFGGVLNVLVFALVADIIPFKRRGNAMGTIMSAFSITSVVGVPLGLLLSDYFGWRSSFVFIVLFSILVFILTIIYLPNVKAKTEKQSITNSILSIFNIAFCKKYLSSYSLVILLALSGFMLIPFLSPYAVKNIGILESELKYLYLVGGFFTVISSKLIGKVCDRFGTFKTFTVLSIISLIPIHYYTTLGTTSLAFFLFVSSLFMVTISGRFIPAMTQVTNVPSETERGAFMGVFNAVRSLTAALATLIAGLMIEEKSNGALVHFERVGYLSIALSLIAIIVFYFMTRNKNDHLKCEQIDKKIRSALS